MLDHCKGCISRLPVVLRRSCDRYIARAAVITIRPTRGLPVKKILSHFFSNSRSATTSPPWTTFTALESKYNGTSLARSAEHEGASSEGFNTTTFPAATAPISGSNDSPRHKRRYKKYQCSCCSFEETNFHSRLTYGEVPRGKYKNKTKWFGYDFCCTRVYEIRYWNLKFISTVS